MAWRSQFKLGRPNREALFEINPSAMTFEDRKLADVERAIDGSLCVVTLSRNRPLIRINGNYVTPAFMNQLRALMMTDDTMLVFESVDALGAQVFESWTERVVPSSLTSIVLPDNSFLRGSALRVAAGGSSPFTCAGVWTLPGAAGGAVGVGTNYAFPSLYAETFETLAVGDLNGQDTWSNINPDIHCLFDVETTEVITGTKSVRFRVLSSGTVSEPVYRRMLGLTIAGAFTFGANMKFVSPVSGEMFDIGGYSSDAWSGPSWKIRVLNIAGTPTVGFHTTNPSAPVFSVPIDYLAHAYEVNVIGGGNVSLSIDGTPVGIASGVPSWDRLMMHGSTITSGSWPRTVGILDDFTLSGNLSSYVDATRTLTIPTALPTLDPAFVTYRCPVIAAHMRAVPGKTEGGWVDVWRYDLELEGA